MQRIASGTPGLTDEGDLDIPSTIRWVEVESEGTKIAADIVEAGTKKDHEGGICSGYSSSRPRIVVLSASHVVVQHTTEYTYYSILYAKKYGNDKGKCLY